MWLDPLTSRIQTRSVYTRRESPASDSRTYSTVPVNIGENTFSINSTCFGLVYRPGSTSERSFISDLRRSAFVAHAPSAPTAHSNSAPASFENPGRVLYTMAHP